MKFHKGMQNYKKKKISPHSLTTFMFRNFEVI
jgi:hypothetical protein